MWINQSEFERVEEDRRFPRLCREREVERGRPLKGQYLDEGLHIAVKQLTVKKAAGSRLRHSQGFRGKSGGPGEMVGGGECKYMATIM